MNVYKVFSTDENNAVFRYACIRSVTVLANNEKEALYIVEKEHGEHFVGVKKEIELIFVNVNTPLVVAIEYDSNYD